MPPVLNQFVTRALDKNQAETLFKLLLKYRCVWGGGLVGTCVRARVRACVRVGRAWDEFGSQRQACS